MGRGVHEPTSRSQIQVTGGGSGVGFAALQNQGTDIADASRQNQTEGNRGLHQGFSKRPTEYKVAVDGLSVYVNNDSPIKD